MEDIIVVCEDNFSETDFHGKAAINETVNEEPFDDSDKGPDYIEENESDSENDTHQRKN